MSNPRPPIGMVFEGLDRLSRELHDFREEQNQAFGILARYIERQKRGITAMPEELTGLRKEVRGLAEELRTAQVDRRLDERDDVQPPAGSA